MPSSRRSGQIIAKGKERWLVRISVGRDPMTGKRVYEAQAVRGPKSAAQAVLNEKLALLSKGKYVRNAKITVGDYLHDWLENIAKSRVRPATFESYKYHLEHYLGETLGGRLLKDLTTFDIQIAYNGLACRRSPRTVQYVHSIFKSALKRAVMMRILVENPCDFVELPKRTKRKIEVFTLEDAKKFLKAADESPRGLIFEFALLTGARPEEYLAIMWSDLDFVRGTVTFQRTLSWVKGGGWVLSDDMKTTLSRRTIPLPSDLTEKLRHHRARQATEIISLGPVYERNDLVFANELGRPLHYGNITKRNFQPILKSAGLGHFRLYSLRHSCATLLLAQGENIKVIQERLGHADVTLTLSTYAHVLDGMQAQASKKLGDLLYSASGR